MYVATYMYVAYCHYSSYNMQWHTYNCGTPISVVYVIYCLHLPNLIMPLTVYFEGLVVYFIYLLLFMLQYNRI